MKIEEWILWLFRFSLRPHRRLVLSQNGERSEKVSSLPSGNNIKYPKENVVREKKLTSQQQLLPKIAFRRAVKSMRHSRWVHVAVARFRRSTFRTRSPEADGLR